MATHSEDLGGPFRALLAPRHLALLAFASMLLFGGCVNVFRKIDATQVEPARGPIAVQAPLKVHLYDGSTVLFPNGAHFFADSLRGVGRRYGLLLADSTRESMLLSIALDSIAAAESYTTGVRPVETVAVTILGTGAALVGIALASVAIFGSCPTIYTSPDSGAVLEAESFSNSIVPLFELRDVDRLSVGADSLGNLVLEIRNEALETHYINHLELVEVRHMPGFIALPGELGEALLLARLASAAVVRDVSGRDVARVVRAADGVAYETASEVLARAAPPYLMDELMFTFPAPDAEDAGLYLRLRNSLLSTVLLYDFMLGAQGPYAFDWLNRELNSIRGALSIRELYQKWMGLRVEVWDGQSYRQVQRLREVGPIAWEEVGVRVPVLQQDSVRIRLRFLADAWRIDHVALADRIVSAETRRIPFSTLSHLKEAVAATAAENLAEPDDRYHVTDPGDRFRAHFEVGRPDAGEERTYFVAAQGYYTEWIRGHWLRDSDPPVRFEASEQTLAAAIQRWATVKDTFQRQFEDTKIPVR